MLRVERRQKPRQHVGRHCRNDAEPEPPGEEAPAVARVVGKVADARQDGRNAARHFLALWRELCACARSLDQGHANLALQLLDLHGKRRLRHRALLRRAPEMQRLSERLEIAELPQRDVQH